MPSTLSYIIFFTLIGSIVSLLGGVLLLMKKGLAEKISHFLAAFAAGALLGTAFFDLLPEAAEEAGEAINIFSWVLAGLLIFFFLERLTHWYHHHHHADTDLTSSPTVPLIIIGDSVHNFIDGAIIAATFMIDIPLGIVTSFAVAAHEIPQEIGDFGILLAAGLARRKVFLINLFSATAAIAGALLIYFIGDSFEKILPILLSLTAGFFIYIAASDLIPEIHDRNTQKLAFLESLMLMAGIFVVFIFVKTLEG